MAKPLLLYSTIYSYIAEAFVEKMNEIESSEDLEVWVNSPGGRVFAGWGMIGPISQRTGKKTAKVFGDASSMALFMLPFFDRVEAIDTARFVLHRADGYVTTEAEKEQLKGINKDLRSKFEKRVNSKKLKEITGFSLNDVFNPDQRIDVTLTAKQAKDIGLIDKIIKLEPTSKEAKALSERFVAFMEFDESDSRGSEKDKLEASRGSGENNQQQKQNNNNQTPKKMTKEEFKAQNPADYNAILAEGKQGAFDAGKLAEKNRVEAFLVYANVDPETVKKEIEAGNDMTPKFMAEMSVKMQSPAYLEALKEDAPDEQSTSKKEAKAKTEAEKEVEAMSDDLDSDLGIKKEAE